MSSIERYEVEITACRERGERDLVEKLVENVLKLYEKEIEKYRERGEFARVERIEDKVVVHKRRLKKDMEVIKAHPS